MNKNFIREWLKKHKYAVLATSFRDMPWAATVDYTCDDDLNISIKTDTTTRKYSNLVKNSNVSLVIDSQTEEGTLQVQGLAAPLKQKGKDDPNVVITPVFMIFRRLDDLGEVRMDMLNF